MRARLLLAVCPLALLAACFSPPPGGKDRDGPRIILTVLNGKGRPRFDSIEQPNNLDDYCATVRNFPSAPAKIVVSLGDPGGIDRAVVRAFFGETIIDDSVVPAPAATVTNNLDVGSDTDFSVITFTPATDGRVLTGALVVLDVRGNSEPTALIIAAEDILGNRTRLPDVLLRPATDDPSICRGAH